MKNILIAVAFAVATLTACSHKSAVVVTDTKVVKTPVKHCAKAKQ